MTVQRKSPDSKEPFVLPAADPAAAGIDPERLARVERVIEGHIAEGRYPGAQIALARHGKLLRYRSFGAARIEPAPVRAGDDTLWLLYSNTKMIVAAAIWLLVEEGALTFHDRVADHVPEFARFGKAEITLIQLLTHQGGFPGAGLDLPRSAWTDHAELRRLVCDFRLDFTPGSRVEYHRVAAHWVCAVLIEAVTGKDYRDFVRARIIEPLGLGADLFLGVPDELASRCAEMYQPAPDGRGQTRLVEENTQEFRRAGMPGSGGFGTARAAAAFYQMMLQGGGLNGIRLLSPRMIQYVTRDFTGDAIDRYMGMPMHRGLGPHSRGTGPGIRGLGSLAPPASFGHGGVGSSYCWADPTTGVSFAYLTNSRVPDPWHSRRLDVISSMVHAAIEDA